MMFCPRCKSILLPNPQDKKIRCGCGYSSNFKKVIIKEKVENNKKIEIIDKTAETLPKTEIECVKCGYDQAYYWLAQTRASDEAETQFFRCCKCGHQWRNY